MADVNSALFRPATGGGWIFRAPSPWPFGDVPHYFVNDVQKARIDAILKPRLRPALLAVVLMVTLFGWVFTVSGLVWTLGSGQDNPTLSDVFTMVVLIVMPIAVAIPFAGWRQRRRLAPILKDAPLTNERISLAELNQTMKNASTAKQSLFACIVSVVASIAALAGIWVRIASKHGLLDGQIILLSFVAVVFGYLAFRWFQMILGKGREK